MQNIKKMRIVTFNGDLVGVEYNNRADLCYSVELPHWLIINRSMMKHNDTIEERGSTFVLRSGSLERVLAIIADFVGRTEL